MTAEYLQDSRFDQHMRSGGRALTLRCRTRCRSFRTCYAESANSVPRVTGPVVRFTDLSLAALVTRPTGPLAVLDRSRAASPPTGKPRAGAVPAVRCVP